MTGQERVRLAFSHQQPDRTPWLEKLIKSPVADWILGRPCLARNFEARMALLEKGAWEELVEREAEDIADLVTMLEMDMVRLYLNVPRDEERVVRLGEGLWKQGENLLRLRPLWGALVMETLKPAGASPEEEEKERIAEIEAEYEPPEPFSEDQLAVFRRVREILHRRGVQPAIMVSVYTLGAATLPAYMWPWFHERPELLRRYYEKNARRGLDFISRWAELDNAVVAQDFSPAHRGGDDARADLKVCATASTPAVDLIALGGDFACDHGSMISPAHYREFILPGIREQAQAVRRAGCFSSNASDGNLWSLLDDFLLSTGVDGYEEIDFAAGMDLALLKQRYGERICFIGNIDCRHLLTSAREEDVRRATVRCLEAGWGNGGHVLMSSNCIHQGVRPENFRAMVDAYRHHFDLEPLCWSAQPPVS